MTAKKNSYTPDECFTSEEVESIMEYRLEGNIIRCNDCNNNQWIVESYHSEGRVIDCASPNCEGTIKRSILHMIADKSSYDPNHIHEPMDTNKLDQGKPMAGVLEDFLPALLQVAMLGSMNNKPNGKYDRGSWMLVENAEQRYLDGFWRHICAGRQNIDPETDMPHDVAIAWNALVLVWFRLKREGKI